MTNPLSDIHTLADIPAVIARAYAAVGQVVFYTLIDSPA